MYVFLRRSKRAHHPAQTEDTNHAVHVLKDQAVELDPTIPADLASCKAPRVTKLGLQKDFTAVNDQVQNEVIGRVNGHEHSGNTRQVEPDIPRKEVSGP